ncbi:hypothetical protein OROGR_018802 [Orobanche gracilis]
MEKVWPPLKECVQFKLGKMQAALWRYPWEDDGYAFDFDSYYPPIPEGLACLRKLLDSAKKKDFRPSFPEDTRNCPFCPLDPNPPHHGPIKVEDVDILNHPVWDMDPIPCPFHLMSHIWLLGGRPAIVTPAQLENTKKYLNQVRNSRGYDVDCIPHRVLVPRIFYEVSNSKLSETIKGELESIVIKHIESKTKKTYNLEKILKIVSADIYVNLVTFTAKVKNDDSAAPETFIATLDGLNPNRIMECLLKPDCDAPGPDHYPVYEIRPISMPSCMRSYMRSCDSQLEFNFWAHQGTCNPGFAKKPIPLTPGKDTSSAAAPASSEPCNISGSKRSREAGSISDPKRMCRVTEAVTSPKAPLPPREDSQCKVAKGWKTSSRELPIRFFGKRHPCAITAEACNAEEMLTMVSDTFFELGLFSGDLANTFLLELKKLKVRLIEEQKKNFELSTGQGKLKEGAEKWKSQDRSSAMDKEACSEGVRTCMESYLKSQAGVTPDNLSPLDPSIVPLQPVEDEPLQTLPPDVEENRDEGGGSSVHVEETSPNPEAQDIPSPPI